MPSITSHPTHVSERIKLRLPQGHGEGALRRALEDVRLPAMEADGWRGFTGAVTRIWGGERGEAELCASLDANTAMLGTLCPSEVVG